MLVEHACCTITELMKLMNEMSVEKWWNEICGGENGKNPEKNLPEPCTVHHDNHMGDWRCELGIPAVGGKQLTACTTRLCNGNTFPTFIHTGLSFQNFPV